MKERWDLRRLNAWTIKDAHSLPQIEETLACLNAAEWSTSLDLKLGYWQVEMEEDCKALTTFTLRPLGFYECERMPFGLTNAPATFQHLMQSCLGNLHLHVLMTSFHIHYKSGESNMEANALSQIDWEKCDETNSVHGNSCSCHCW